MSQSHFFLQSTKMLRFFQLLSSKFRLIKLGFKKFLKICPRKGGDSQKFAAKNEMEMAHKKRSDRPTSVAGVCTLYYFASVPNPAFSLYNIANKPSMFKKIQKTSCSLNTFYDINLPIRTATVRKRYFTSQFICCNLTQFVIIYFLFRQIFHF